MKNRLCLLIMVNKTPYVGAALICERVIQETDGVLSIVRVVETFTVAPIRDLPAGVKRGIEFTLLIMLKSGDVKGKSKVSIRLRYPSGKTKPMGDHEIVLEGGHSGIQVIIQTRVGIEEWGVHWFDIAWEGQMLTSIPLRLVEGSSSDKVTGSEEAKS